jgi:hypothetical protein
LPPIGTPQQTAGTPSTNREAAQRIAGNNRCTAFQPGAIVSLSKKGVGAAKGSSDAGTRRNETYANAFELIHRRKADRPNAIWQADHTLLDIMLVRDEARPAKPWLTVVSDDYSRAVAGYFLSFEARSRPLWRCARQSGVRKILAGMFVGSRRSFIRITAAILPLGIWNKSANQRQETLSYWSEALKRWKSPIITRRKNYG